MTVAGIALIIIAAAIGILVLMLIPTLLTLKRAAASVGSLADMVQQELRPTLQELPLVLAELKAVGGGVAEHTEDVKCFMSALGATGENLHSINRSVGVVTSVLHSTSAWATGAKVAGKYILERYLKKRGGR
ncbi:DUF948 domain-containing protein [Geobacter sp. SVR]|uniref:DUF948 domain-containing protein n=1 Tax=Geobacter sp. SVR TaxID=2495594 RepID=UPI00143EFE15|nr:DUF948 domain-containing protein [Geobacter sp. SVR]BCS55859.1 hypothetical protein GSVR_41670 [Geobacter sp. SVR]GCF83863.1 hypothetical protein GSbR_04630 [Geobacter sp. SVR]